MKNLFAIYNTYMGQSGPDDCGIACLSMLLNYCGRYDDGCKLFFSARASPGGLSLLELRDIAAEYDLPARCVRMDPETLRHLRSPCVLHSVNHAKAFHFVVCYTARIKNNSWCYLIGDPSTGISWRSEAALALLWPDGVALYPGDLHLRFPPVRNWLWFTLLRSVWSEKVLFVSLPLLNLAAALLGIALTWLLQRGINYPITDQRTSFIAGVVILLGMIMFARSIGNYIKQLLLIKLNTGLREKYITLFLKRWAGRVYEPAALKREYGRLQKIQNAVIALFSVFVAEGALAVLLTAGMFYFEPVAGLVILLHLLCCVWYGIYSSAGLLWQQADLTELQALHESSLTSVISGMMSEETLFGEQIDLTLRARSIAVNISKHTFYYDCLATMAIILVLTYCFYGLHKSLLSYNMLISEVVVCYFITVLNTKICQVFPVITDGARTLKKYQF